MKKLIAIFMASILALGLLAGCSKDQTVEKEANEEVKDEAGKSDEAGEKQAEHDDEQQKEQTAEDKEPESDNSESDQAEESNDEEAASTDDQQDEEREEAKAPSASELKTYSGKFIGRADTNSIEVEHNGEVRVFYLSEDVKSMIDQLEEGITIQFSYSENANGQQIIEYIQ